MPPSPAAAVADAELQPAHAAYWCFISYRHADNHEQGRQWATWLHHALETYEVPADLVGTLNDLGEKIPERIFPVFRDEEELPADADLASPIRRALDRSKYLVVLCSPRAAESAYVTEEIRYFKQIGRAGRILAALLDGEPNASWDLGKQRLGARPQEECFPISLRHPVDAQGRLVESERAEPIAADFRLPDGGQGWTSPEAYRLELKKDAALDDAEIEHRVADYRQRCELAKLKIVAGALGIALGRLTRRDKAYQLEKAKRRAKILWRVAAAMTALAVAAGIAGGYAFLREKDARREKAKSDDLSDYMLGDLYDRLEPLGRVDLLDETADRLSRQLPAAVPDDDDERLRWLRLRLRVAKIRLAQGRVTEAYDLAKAARNLPEKRFGDRKQIELVPARADLLNLAGDIGARIGAGKEGEDCARQAAGLYHQKWIQPGSKNAEIAQAWINIADYGFLSAPERHDEIERAVDLAKTAATREGAPLSAQEIYLRALLRQARLHEDREEWKEALSVLNTREEVLSSFARARPDHWLWSRERVVNGIEITKIDIARSYDSVDRAETALTEALALEARDPSNLEWRRIAATAYNNRGLALMASRGSSAPVEESFQQALRRFQQLADFAPRNLGWRSALAWTHDGLRAFYRERAGSLDTDRDAAKREAADREAAVREAIQAVELLESTYLDLGNPPGGQAAQEWLTALARRANDQLEADAPRDAAATLDRANDLIARMQSGRPSTDDAVAAGKILLTRMRLGRYESSSAAETQATETLVLLLEKAAPDRPSLRRTLALLHLNLARLALPASGQPTPPTAEREAARRHAAAAVQILEALNPEDTTYLPPAREVLQSLSTSAEGH